MSKALQFLRNQRQLGLLGNALGIEPDDFLLELFNLPAKLLLLSLKRGHASLEELYLAGHHVVDVRVGELRCDVFGERDP